MHLTTNDSEKAVLFGVHTGSRDYINDCTPESIEELARLAETAGAQVMGSLIQNRPVPEGSTYLGEGKLKELSRLCDANDAGLVICDDELTGTQVKNIENALNLRVIDRSSLIMDIFAQSAKTKEGKLQVELAQLKYFLPRLTGSFTGMSRQAGGGGGIGGARRGPGEKKLETDRRHIRNRIMTITKQLSQVHHSRNTQRKLRVKQGITQVAIVGYTNAGKSTLMNYLTNAGVLTEDKLFATLDPTYKKLSLPDGSDALIIDTVGFIRKLPHHLIEAFKSTLEEASGADVLLHVADASSPYLYDNIKVVEDLLRQLGASDKPILTVFNKIDLADKRPAGIAISAKTGEGTAEMLDALCRVLPEKRRRVTVLIPYDKGDIVDMLYKNAKPYKESHTDKGVLLDISVDGRLFSIVSDFIV